VYAGVERFAVYNPFRFPIALKIVAAMPRYCPHDCNGHGTCEADGSCTCEEGFIGADCVQCSGHHSSGGGSGASSNSSSSGMSGGGGEPPLALYIASRRAPSVC
jgi:uncharacterized membrane protein YgcG